MIYLFNTIRRTLARLPENQAIVVMALVFLPAVALYVVGFGQLIYWAGVSTIAVWFFGVATAAIVAVVFLGWETLAAIFRREGRRDRDEPQEADEDPAKLHAELMQAMDQLNRMRKANEELQARLDEYVTRGI